LLRPEDPGFDAALDIKFPGMRSVPGFQTIKPLLVIFENESSHDLMAFVVQWTITNQDGSTTKTLLPVMHEPRGHWEPSGDKAILTGQKRVLHSKETELISPFFHWSASQFSGLLSVHAVEITVSDSLRKPLMLQSQMQHNFDAALDAVIYDDGLFVGGNESKLFERYMAEQLIQRDEGISIFKLIRNGTSDSEIASKLSQQIQKGNASTGTDNLSLYDAARGRTARRLLAELQSSRGRDGLQTMAARLARAQVTRLRRALAP